MSKKYFLGIDTETANSYTNEDGKVELKDSLCYDIGWAIIDKKGKVYKTRSFVVAEIFLDKELMTSAYFAEKIPQYWEDIKTGKRKLKTLKNIHWIFKQDCKKYSPKAIFAHNAYFDYNALNNTLRFITGSRNRYFYPYGIELWDTLKMARDAIGKTEKYSDYCQKNGYLTCHKHPQNRLTAEILWRYISNNPDFEESHTGLEDVEIEKEIFVECLKKKDVKRLLFKKQ